MSLPQHAQKLKQLADAKHATEVDMLKDYNQLSQMLQTFSGMIQQNVQVSVNVSRALDDVYQALQNPNPADFKALADKVRQQMQQIDDMLKAQANQFKA